MRLIDADEFIKNINNAEENFKSDNIESINGDIEDPFVDGVLSGIFNICLMVSKTETVKAIPLDKVKQAREEIENEIKFWSEPPKAKLLPSVKAVRDGKVNSYKHCLEILDRLMESEE